MPTPINRRRWLKTATAFTGGLALVPQYFSSLHAMPSATVSSGSCLTDAALARLMPPGLKARLFANENPFGPSEKVRKAIERSLAHAYQYPFEQVDQMYGQIAVREGLKGDMIMPGGGSSPLLFATALCFSREGGSVVSGMPTYEDLPALAEKLGMKWKKVPTTPEFKLDLDAMEKAVDSSTKLVYVCNPNNPTGTAVDAEQLKAFCERVSQKAMVFVDEAYIDYLPDPKASSMMDCVRKGQNIIVARTFSKLYGFAGLRIGYIAAQPTMIKKLEPYSTWVFCLNTPAIGGLLAGYGDTEFLSSALQKTNASKEYLYSVLKDEGYSYVPSSTNFVFFPIKMEGQRFESELRKRGVGIRTWKVDNKDFCRVSIGRMDEMETFAQAFKEIS